MIFPFIGLELYGQVAKENYQDSIFLDLRGDLRDPEVLGRDWEVVEAQLSYGLQL